MIKILIDNEEVVSDKNFTIQEEMLNTSSVILNNVYPKTWETTKDYTSQFYYPKDYSKCLVLDETYVPAEEGLRVSGSNFSINVDTTKEDEYSFKGDTSQSGTPTPSSPIPVNVVTGEQEVNVCRKNLFDKNTSIVTGKTYASDGTLNNLSAGFVQESYIGVNSSTYYTLSTTNDYSSDANFRIQICEYDENKNFIKRNSGTYNTGVRTSYTVQLNENTKYVRLGGMNNLINELQFEKGSTATTYEAYTGQSYEINLGKNLIPNNATTQEISGVTFTVNEDKSITVNGTATANINYVINQHLTMELGTYTLSGCPAGGSYSTYYLRLALLGSYTFYADTGNGHTKTYSSFTVDNTNTTYGIYIGNGTVCNNLVFKPQFEKGSQATSYAPYKTPIELCKKGNYQDKIFKNTPASIYYDNTLEEDAWYLYKTINHKVLDSPTIVAINGTASGVNQTSSDGAFAMILSNNNITNVANEDMFTECFKYEKANITSNAGANSMTNNTFCLRQNNNDRIYFRSSSLVGKTGTEISNTLKPINLHYVSSNPTTTKIEDTELINQLDSIEFLEGLNNVSISSLYLPLIMDLHYNFVTPHTITDTLFNGIVKNTGNISLNPREPHYCSLQIVDYKTLLSEGATLDYVIANKTITQAIQMVVDSISDYNVQLGTISIANPDEIIGAYSTLEKTPYDVFQYLADISQSRWITTTDENGVLYVSFYDPTLMPSGTSIQYTNEWFTNNNINDMSFNYGTYDYRNKQIMTSNEVYGSINQEQEITASGYTTVYPVENKIGIVNVITVNGIEKSIITNAEKDDGASADFYYTPGESQFESAETIPAGSELYISYTPIVLGRQILQNYSEIARINSQLDRNGVISRYENRNDALTSQELQKVGKSYLKYKGKPEVNITINTLSNIWNIGQVVSFENAPLNELTTDYMVKSKKTEYIASIEKVFYEFTLTSNFNAEDDINYFDNQRSKSKGNISAGNTINRNIDIENTAQIIFQNVSIEKITITGDNTLNAVLNAPFVE